MKFIQESSAGTKEILFIKDHAVAISGMVAAADGVADALGKKILPAGTFVGGVAASFLADRSQLLRVIGCKATLTTAMTGANNDIVLTALAPGDEGTAVSLTLVDPAGNSAALAITVTGKAISVALATGEAGAITTTGAALIAAINADTNAKKLVVASAPAGDTGESAVTALAKTVLVSGPITGAAVVDGVLLEDVDVTYGDKICPVLIHGFLKATALPMAPTAAILAAFSPSLQLSFIEC